MRAFLILGLALLALPAAAQSPRPVPTLFANGSCDAACAAGRWTDFLKAHGQAPLMGETTQVRVTTFNAEGCPNRDDDVDILRLTLGDKPVLDRDHCGTKTSKPVAGDRLEALNKALATPDLATLNGAFPAYCGEFEGQEEHAFHLIEFLEQGRYRLIEWDCETPRPLKPLSIWFDL